MEFIAIGILGLLFAIELMLYAIYLRLVTLTGLLKDRQYE